MSTEPGSDWRHATVQTIRTLITEADPDAIEETKWVKPSNPAGVPVWSHDGIICTAETYRDKVTFFEGAALDDPQHLFNAGLGGGTRRAIDLTEGAVVDADAFTALVRQAVDRNVARAAAKRRR